AQRPARARPAGDASAGIGRRGRRSHLRSAFTTRASAYPEDSRSRTGQGFPSSTPSVKAALSTSRPYPRRHSEEVRNESRPLHRPPAELDDDEGGKGVMELWS